MSFKRFEVPTSHHYKDILKDVKILDKTKKWREVQRTCTLVKRVSLDF